MPADHALYAPALWERARDDYLCGETAAEVCARYGFSRSQFYAQARMGGWRRADQPGVAPQAFAGPPEPEADDGAPAPPTRELAADALRQGARAMARGRLREAQGWMRLAADLRALAVEETPDALDWCGVLHAAKAAAPAAAPAPDAPSVDDLLRSVEAVGRIARDASALLDAEAAPGPGADRAAEALLARADALLRTDAGASPAAPPSDPPGPAAGPAAPPCAATEAPAAPVAPAAPDSPDGLSEPDCGVDDFVPPPPFRGPEDGPEWPAYCRARAAERPHQTFWIAFAEMAEAKLAQRPAPPGAPQPF